MSNIQKWDGKAIQADGRISSLCVHNKTTKCTTVYYLLMYFLVVCLIVSKDSWELSTDKQENCIQMKDYLKEKAANKLFIFSVSHLYLS